jgi:hypothetical protein
MQRELDALDSARKQVVEFLSTLSATMRNPTAQFAERVAYCPRHSENRTGSLCAHCELDDLFQVLKPILVRTIINFSWLTDIQIFLIVSYQVVHTCCEEGSSDQRCLPQTEPLSCGLLILPVMRNIVF